MGRVTRWSVGEVNLARWTATFRAHAILTLAIACGLPSIAEAQDIHMDNDSGVINALQISTLYDQEMAFVVVSPTNIEFSNNQIGVDNNYGVVSTDGPFSWEANSLASTGQFIDVKGEIDPTVTATTPTSIPTVEATSTTTPGTPTTTSLSETTTTSTSTSTTDAEVVLATDADDSGGWGSGPVLVAAVLLGGILGAAPLWSAQRAGRS